jgi:osmotically-inducible protein OsmY
MSKHRASRILTLSAFVVMMALSPLAFGEGAGQYIDDAAITAKVKAALMSDSQLKATQVKVETTQGSVQLTGMVNTKDQESEAVHAANKIDGVKSVEDLLTVRSTEQQ